MLSTTSRLAATQRIQSITRPPLLNPISIRAASLLPWNPPTKSPRSSKNLHLPPKRNYIFLPSTIDDMMKLIKSQSNESGRIMVKLSTRWHDQLGIVLDRYDNLLRQTSSSLLSNIKTRTTQTTTNASPSKTFNRYKSLKMWGMNRLLTHYNAKKRVYARRKKTFKSFKRMNASEVKSYREQYYAQKKARLHVGLNRLRVKVEAKRKELRDWLFNGTKSCQNDGSIKLNSPTDGNNTKWKSLTLTEPSQLSWFDSEGYPLTSREETGRFVNPWLSQSTNGENGLVKFFRWKAEGLMRRLGLDVGREDESHSSFGANDGKSVYRHETRPYTTTVSANEARQTIQLAWLGHATTLVTFPGNFTILTDPHFSNYAGPMKRNDPPPLGVLELPCIDCVLISHDHMDHLDYWSILELVDSNKVKFWVVPLGIKEWLINKAGVCPEHIVELEWWEGVRFSKGVGKSDGSSHLLTSPKVEGLVRAFDNSSQQSLIHNQTLHSDRNELVVTCVPAQHWCSRTPFDRNRRLWCSYAVHATPCTTENLTSGRPQKHSFYFAGDTGLPPEFPLHHQIGDRLGPFDLAAIPIGAYEPRWFMKESHCNPTEAVVIHQAIRSRRSVAIHFDTFNLADEPQAEPPKMLMDEVDRVNDEIAQMATEVVAVADEMSAVVPVVDGQLVGEMERSPDNIEEGSLSACDSLKETKELMDILPPRVDFAVIQQGHCIESSPK